MNLVKDENYLELIKSIKPQTNPKNLQKAIFFFFGPWITWIQKIKTKKLQKNQNSKKQRNQTKSKQRKNFQQRQITSHKITITLIGDFLRAKAEARRQWNDITNELEQKWANFLLNCQIINILDLQAIWFLLQLFKCYCWMTAAIDSM